MFSRVPIARQESSRGHVPVDDVASQTAAVCASAGRAKGNAPHTLHLPSINTSAETGYGFVGVFHTPNQRHARPYYSKQTITQFPKLDVAGSSPVSQLHLIFNSLATAERWKNR